MNKKPSVKIVFSLIAFVFVFMGFGMIHGSTQVIEKMGSIFIGLGTLYFIVLLSIPYFSKKGKKMDQE